MLKPEDPPPSGAFGKPPPNDDYMNRLTMDMTGLNLSHLDNENALSKTFTEQGDFAGTHDTTWFSDMLDSSSCDNSASFMYDSMNSQATEKLSYSFTPEGLSEITTHDLGLTNTIPLLDYFPNYSADAKFPELESSNADTSVSLSSSFNQQRLNSTQHLSSSSESFPLDNAAKQSHRRTLFELGENYVYLKVLATQLVSGTIIGRGGKGLNWFRRKSKVDDIIISMPWELYPKTEYRTMLLKGTLKSVVKSICIISDLMNSRYAMLAENTMMVIVVLPDVFIPAINEIQRTTNQSVLNITLFRDDDSGNNEVVAVVKGGKSKVKDLVAAMATSISETVSHDKYCFVTYGPDDRGRAQAHEADPQAEALRRSRTRAYQQAHCRPGEPDELDALMLQLENAVDRGNLGTLSKIAALVRHRPELLSRPLEVQVALPLPLPDEALALAALYNCEIAQRDEGGAARVRLAGEFASCFAALLVLLLKAPG